MKKLEKKVPKKEKSMKVQGLIEKKKKKKR